MAEELYLGLGGAGGGVGGSFTAGASTGGNTAGTTGTVSNGMLFFGGANITLSESSGAGGASMSIVGGAGAAFSGGVSTGGNSAGTTGTVGNGIRFFGGNNITLSQSSAAGGAIISFVGPNTSAQQTGISGIAGSGASTVTNGTVQFSNLNGVSFGLNGSTMTASVSQSVQTQNSVQINGSSGAISFNAGNNMSLSTVASNLTFINVLSSSLIAQNVSNVSSAGTLSSRFALADHAHIGLAGVNASGTASTFVGNLMLSGTNLTLVTGGNSSAGSIGFSVAAQSVQPEGTQTIGMSNIGNTSGTSGVATGTGVQFLFAGGNNITLSQSINGASGTITISGGAGGAFSAGVSTQGNTSGTTGTVNNGVVFVGGNNITLSQSSGAGGATVTISAPSGGGVGVSTGGNTSGTTGTVDYQMIFVGGNNITLSQSTNGSSGTITISAGAGGGGFQSAGISTGGNTAGTTGFASSQILFYGGANITLSQSLGGGNASLSIIGGAGAGGAAIGMTNTGNTSGTTFSSTSGTMYFQGTNNVTVSNSSAAGVQTLWISGPTGGGAGMGTGANTSGTSGTVGKELYFYGGTNISLSQSVNGGSASLSIIGASGGGAAFSAGMSTNGFTAGTTGLASQRLVLAGGANITLSGSTNGGSMTITISSPNQSCVKSVGYSTQGNTAGQTGFAGQNNGVTLVGGNNITLSGSNDAGDMIITIIGAAGGGGAAIGITNTGNTSGTNFTTATGTVYFQGSNNITVSNSSAAGSLQTIWISGPTQTVQTQNSVQINGSSGAISFNAGNNMSLSTVASNLTFINVLSSSGIAQNVSNVSSAGTQSSRYALADHAHIGVAGINASGTASTFVGNMMFSVTNLTLVTGGNSSAGTIGISAASQTVQPEGTNTIGASNLGNTLGTSGVVTGTGIQFAIVGSNNITLSQSINGASGTISIIGAAGASGGAVIGITNTGNTSGTNFTTNTGTVYFQGTNNITVSNSTGASLQTIWISGPTGGGVGMGSTSNTFGTSGSVGKELYLYGGGQVSLSQSVNGGSASLTILGEPLRSKFYWMPDGAVSSSAMTHGSASFQVVMVPYDLSFTRVDIPLLIASTSSATTNTCAFVISSGCVIYSVSNNSTLNPIIGSFGTTTHTFASNTAGNQSLSGGRFASFAMGTSLSAGWYVVGFQLSTANTSSVGASTTAIPFAVSVLLGSNYTASGFNDLGSASAATTDVAWGRGVANSTITATNATMNINGITGTGVSKFRGNFHVLFRAIS